MNRWFMIMTMSVLLALLSTASFAHKPSDSYVRLKVEDTIIHGQWDIALRDLDYAIGLDRDDDGLITWRELQTRHAAIATYALARLHINGDGTSCSSRPTKHSGGSS